MCSTENPVGVELAVRVQAASKEAARRCRGLVMRRRNKQAGKGRKRTATNGWAEG
jgi:hypothetical protein